MPPSHPVPPILLTRARELRRPQTPAEQKLWARVRAGQLGCKIRRQHPCWRFILDFYCAPARLVIEIDGDTHAAPDQAAYDAARTAWLTARGCAILRFHNDDIHHNLEAVLTTLQTACHTRLQQLQNPPPAPPVP